MDSGGVGSASGMLRRLNIGSGASNGGSPSRNAAVGPPITMQDLHGKEVITPNDVKRLNCIADGEVFQKLIKIEFFLES